MTGLGERSKVLKPVNLIFQLVIKKTIEYRLPNMIVAKTIKLVFSFVKTKASAGNIIGKIVIKYLGDGLKPACHS
jgi:hypothetical protein